MKLNLNKLIYSKKFIDIFCYVFCGIYFLFALCYIVVDNQNTNRIQNELNNMILHANLVNQKIQENLFFNSTENEEEISSDPLFTDGKTAIISGYNKTLDSNSFYGEALGNMTTTTAGMTVKVSSYTQVIKYNPTTYYDNRANKLIETNASSMFMDMINDLANNGVKSYKKNGQINKISTKNVYFENNIPTANFSGAKFETNVKVPMIGESLYIVNEETVKEITYFKIKYKNGVPCEYYVQAKLDPVKSTEKFKEILKTGANLTKDPVYNEVTITVIINAKGYVTNVTTIDKSTIEKMGLDCPCTMTQTYTISGFNEEITYFDEDFS